MSEPVEFSHPAVLIEEFARVLDGGAFFNLSYYRYRPQSLLDERRLIQVRARELTVSRVEELLAGLLEGEELAFHSLVTTGKRGGFHLPMIDFSGRLGRDSLGVLRDVLGTRYFDALRLYDSGRSFHGYIMKPLPFRQWVSFMGMLLLVNLPERSQVTDSRWVGHRLCAGYASLRWSKNTQHYHAAPRFISVSKILG
ncbi:hypothetical protein [Corallococcus sp. 4LFB]|uniref:primase 1D-like protein n=1 Tax=Corallococcus sp. 4LFB TaxID=3383249 RepID=UPI0039751C9F